MLFIHFFVTVFSFSNTATHGFSSNRARPYPTFTSSSSSTISFDEQQFIPGHHQHSDISLSLLPIRGSLPVSSNHISKSRIKQQLGHRCHQRWSLIRLGAESTSAAGGSSGDNSEEGDDAARQSVNSTTTTTSDDNGTSTVVEVVDVEVVTETSAANTTEKTNVFRKIVRYFKGEKQNDGLTFRQRMAKMGLTVMLSYGWVSNMSYCICVSIAWFLFSKQTGLSPLAPGQWKKFLAVYAGFYVFQNIIRPFRVAISVAVAPQFDAIVAWVQRRLNLKRKGVAIGLTVLVVNLFGTTAICAGMISLAAALAGVPVFPPKP